MLILLPSSKTMDFFASSHKEFTQPQLLEDAKKLVQEYKKLSVQEIMKKMKVSEKIGTLTHGRFQSISFPHSLKNAKQAIFAFQGDVYKNVKPEEYDDSQLEYAQENLRILSGLYGVLRPLDLMQPYRLEMDLTRKQLRDSVTKIINSEKDDVIVNLASKEYFSSITQTDKRIITPVFKERKGETYKMVTIYVKIARGTMANWIIKNKISNVKDLEKFDEDGYSFSKKDSTENELVFLRG